MSTNVQPIPEGFHTVTPYLIIKGAGKAIEFYKRAFNATERFRFAGPDGVTIGHAEIKIGNSIVMMADEVPGCGFKSPGALNGTPVSFVLYSEDVDAAFKQAVDAGATVTRPVENKFYGERAGMLTDPFGHQWTIMTHVEDVSDEEMQRRLKAEFEKMAEKKGS